FFEDLDGLADGEFGDDLRGVKGGGALAVAGGLAVDKGAGGVELAGPLGAAGGQLLVFHNVGVVRQAQVFISGDDPGALGVIALGSDLVEIALCDKAGIGHQALVDLAEFGNTQGGVRDEAAVLTLLFFGEQEVDEDLVEGHVVEFHRVDVAGLLRQEEVCLEIAEVEAVVRGILHEVLSLARVVALVDEADELCDGFVEMRALLCAGGHGLGKDEVAQAGQPLAFCVFGRAEGEGYGRWGGFRGEGEEGAGEGVRALAWRRWRSSTLLPMISMERLMAPRSDSETFTAWARESSRVSVHQVVPSAARSTFSRAKMTAACCISPPDFLSPRSTTVPRST